MNKQKLKEKIKEIITGRYDIDDILEAIDKAEAEDALPAFCLQEAEFYLERLHLTYTKQDIEDCAATLLERSEDWINSELSMEICEQIHTANYRTSIKCDHCSGTAVFYNQVNDCKTHVCPDCGFTTIRYVK